MTWDPPCVRTKQHAGTAAGITGVFPISALCPPARFCLLQNEHEQKSICESIQEKKPGGALGPGV